MGFMDKVRAGAEQAKELAEQAAAKAKEEAKELGLKRELGQAEAELGRAAFGLVEEGQLAHGALDEHVERIRSLRAELDALGERGGEAGEAAGGPAEERGESTPSAPPAMPS